MKTAAVFPGQGAQYVGMGRDVADTPVARAAFEYADSALGWSLSERCFEGPKEALDETRVAQPAVFVLSHIYWLSLSEPAMKLIAFVAGHSLGEFSAAVASGALSFEAGLRLVARRAEIMSAAAAAHPGGMAAVLGLDNDAISGYVDGVEGLAVANYNCPGQVVISGESTALEAAAPALKEMGAKRVLPLAVSGAFHSPLMAEAQAEFAEFLSRHEFTEPHTPLGSSVTGDVLTSGQAIKESLARQITSPVRWQQLIERLSALGTRGFLEVGPGKVLTGLIARIAPDADAWAVEMAESAKGAGSQSRGP